MTATQRLNLHLNRNFAGTIEQKRERKAVACDQRLTQVNQHQVQSTRLEGGLSPRIHVDGEHSAHSHQVTLPLVDVQLDHTRHWS